MNRLPHSHSEQGNQSAYCDMTNYQFQNHTFRLDQTSQQQQHQPQHHAHYQPQLRMDRRGSLLNATSNYNHMNYQNGDTNSINNDRHIYNHYPQQNQQFSTTNQQQVYIHDSQLNETPLGLYQVPGQGNESMPYEHQASYSSNMHHMQQDDMQIPGQLYNPTPLFRPQIHHHNSHHQHQHHQALQHYQYNEGIVIPQQDHQQLHIQQDFILPEHLQTAQQTEILGQTEAEFASGAIIDQNQVFYQQEQMDLLPTIKQQQQMQQQMQLRQQNNMGVEASSLSAGIADMAPSMLDTSYGAQMREPMPMSQPQQLSESHRNLISLPQPQSHHHHHHHHQQQQQQQQQHHHHQAYQLMSRSKSDLTSPVVFNNGNTFNSQPTSLHQYQRPSSTTSYLSNDNANNNQLIQQRVPSSSISDESNSAVPVNNTSRGHQDDFVDMRSCGSVSQDWLDTICRHLIDHMNRFGICVIDNFLGNYKGELILKEVQQLYNSGQYTRGRLVSSKLNSTRQTTEGSLMGNGSSSSTASNENGGAVAAIRNDRVIWIDGYEEGCSEINNLIQTLCSVIINSSRLSLYSNNGLDKIVINKRTKAHVACYPGNGTRYIKHVDNPNNDGRVITSIYYLNKDWSTKRDGGLLRMYPVGMNEVANIEPLFDRVLFFWSDRRNPHEVLPAYRDRFAITVWYIGENRP